MSKIVGAGGIFAVFDLYKCSQLFQYRRAASVFALGIFETIVEKANLEKSVIYRWEDARCLSFILNFIKKIGGGYVTTWAFTKDIQMIK